MAGAPVVQKFAPMKPAAPVTSSLRVMEFPLSVVFEIVEHRAQRRAPVPARRGQQRQRGTLVEHAVGGAARRRGIVLGAYRLDRHRALQQPARQRLLLDRHREVIPAGDAEIGPVQDALHFRPQRELPQGAGQQAGPGGRADLVGDHRHALALAPRMSRSIVFTKLLPCAE